MMENPVRRPMVPPIERNVKSARFIVNSLPTHCGHDVFKLGSSVLGDPVKCGSVEVDLDKLQSCLVIEL